jgi:hypothetical protein
MATRPEKPGRAYIWNANFNNGAGKKKGKWVKPKKPKNATWNDDKGWITKEDAATEWGFALTILDAKGAEQVQTVFNQAWADLKKGVEWSEAKFINAIQKTDWYMDRSEAQRVYFKIKNDPTQAAELEAKIVGNMESLRASAELLGATLTDAQLRKLADENLMNGWNAEQIESNLAKYIKYSTDPNTGFQTLIGAAGNVEDDIRLFAKQMGVEVDDKFVLEKSQAAVQAGNDTQAAKDFIRARAKEKYGAYASELDTSTVEQVSYNYRSSMANLLEVGIDEVSLDDTLIKQAMAVGDGQGGKKNLFQFEQELRKDPRWAKTKNAKEASSTIVNDVLSTFGLI